MHNGYNIVKRYFAYILGVLSLVVISCEDGLDAQSFGVAVSENFYETPEQAEQALIAAYSPMRHLNGREFWGTMASDIIFGDIGTDDFNKGGKDSQDNQPLLEKETYSITTTNPVFLSLWQYNFQGILFANLVLENVPTIEFDNEVRKKEILAEAYFLRAFYYFDLVNSFGGVPLVEKPLSLEELKLPRATQEESYAFIEADLEKAITDLPSRFDKGEEYIGRADKGAALGIMMRVLLYQNKLDEIPAYGDQLFALGYSLTENYSTIFEPEGEWNSGSIFEINYISDAANNLGTGIPLRLDRFVFANQDLLDAYETNDPRQSATLYVKNGNNHIKKYSWTGNYPKPSTVGSINRNSANNIRVIRLADAYLMYAEAIYDTNPTKAVEYLNMIRTRARGSEPATVLPNYPNTLNGEPLLNAIYHERRIELAGEGLRFHDLVRREEAETTLGTKGFKKGIHELVPIPFTEVTISGGVLNQNPGY